MIRPPYPFPGRWSDPSLVHNPHYQHVWLFPTSWSQRPYPAFYSPCAPSSPWSQVDPSCEQAQTQIPEDPEEEEEVGAIEAEDQEWLAIDKNKEPEDEYELGLELTDEWAAKLLETVKRRQAKLRRERKRAQKERRTAKLKSKDTMVGVMSQTSNGANATESAADLSTGTGMVGNEPALTARKRQLQALYGDRAIAIGELEVALERKYKEQQPATLWPIVPIRQ